MTDSILTHWRTLIAIWFAICVINYMPSPNGSGWTASVWYKWLFGTLHGFAAGVPRVIVTLFPALAKFVPGAGASNGAIGGSGG